MRHTIHSKIGKLAQNRIFKARRGIGAGNLFSEFVVAGPPIPRMELLLKLSFGDRAEAGVCSEHVREHRRLCERDLAFFDEIEPGVEQMARAHRRVGFGLLTLRYGRLLREAELRWCDEALERLVRLDHQQDAGRTGGVRG